MQLTNTQLDLIDRFLEQHQLDFLDFKLEVKDHLACETEQIMANEIITFEDAFKTVIKNWHKNLTPSKYSWLINNRRTFPNFVFNRMRNKYINFHLIGFYGLAFFIIFPNFYDKLSQLFSPYKNVLLLGLTFLYLLNLIAYLKLKKEATKTSYSYMFNQVSYNGFLLIFLIVFMNNLLVFGVYFIVFSIPILIDNYTKHYRFINKYHFI